MTLLLPEFLKALRRDQIGVMLEWTLPEPAHRWNWNRWFRKLEPTLKSASTRRYLFSSGEKETVPEHVVHHVRADALVLMNQGRFHLPHPVCWIEDPFHSIESRFFMLATEKRNTISVLPFLDLPNPSSRSRRFLFVGGEVIIRPEEITDKFYFRWIATPDIVPDPPAVQCEVLQNIDTAIRMFVVTADQRGVEPVGDHYEMRRS